ncbi:gliding motility-associated C-terminal domain-containing protein [Mucilaginibacter sp. AW1-7]|uniref:YVTN family beta-propeller repeat protein n=1 Tax=Mucilaginibacter sp. AW1-7 TaxID=3349874 RepID=UPI003F73F1F8
MNKYLLSLSIFIYFLFSSLYAVAQHQDVNGGQITNPINFNGTGCYYKWTVDNPSVGLPTSGGGDIPAFTAINTSKSPITATITATPQNRNFAYIPNNNSASVSVIDLSDNSTVATIATDMQPYAIAISKDGGRAYVTCAPSPPLTNYLDVINTADNTVIRKITLGYGLLGCLAVSPDGSKVYVENYDQGEIYVINTSTFEVDAPILVASKPLGMVISPDGSTLYVTNYGQSCVSAINTATNQVTKIPTGQDPYYLAITPDGAKLYVTDTSIGNTNITIINTANKSVEKVIPIINQYPDGVAVSPDGKKVYVTGGHIPMLWQIDNATEQIDYAATLDNEPIGVSVSYDNSLVYLANGLFTTVSVFDPVARKTKEDISVGYNPIAIGNFISNSTCTNSKPVTYTITVNPTQVSPTITAGSVTGNIASCAGAPSASPNIEQFTVEGSGLIADIIATAPAGFEISAMALSGYGTTLRLPEVNGTVSKQVIYVRSATNALGSIAGDVKLSSGIKNTGVSVKGIVKALPTADKVPSQVKVAGDTTNAITFSGTATAFNWTNDNPVIGLPASGTGDISSFTALNPGKGTIKANIVVTPVSAGYAYISSSQTANISVLNTATNKVVTTIPVGKEPWGVSVSPDDSKVYVSNLASNSVSVIDARTNVVVSTISVGVNPTGIAVSPDGSRVAVAVTNGNGNTISDVAIIDGATNSIIKVVPFSYPVQAVAFSPDGSKMYVTNGNGQIAVVNSSTYEITYIDLGLGYYAAPVALTLSADGGKLYVADANAGAVSVIDTKANSVLSTVTTGPYINNLLLSPDGKNLYVTQISPSNVVVINTETNSIIKNIQVDLGPRGLSLSPDGTGVYVTNQNANGVTLIDIATNTVVSTFDVCEEPSAMGNFTNHGTGCTGPPVTFSITVSAAPPVITAGAITGTIQACAGTPSSSPNIEQFTVEASNLSADITATAPTGFEVSLTPMAGYGKTITLAQTNGTVTAKVIYVRSSASATSNVAGNVVLSSGTTKQNVAVNAIVSPLPAADKINDQTKVNGQATDAVTFSGTGNLYTWVNDNPLVGLPASGVGDIASFKAINSTANSVQAHITVTPYSGPLGYTANYYDGTVSVFNTLSSKVMATIPVGKQPLSIAIHPDGSKVYIGNSNFNTIQVINTATNKVSDVITVGTERLDAGLVITNDGKFLYATTQSSSGIVRIISTETNRLVGSIDLGAFGVYGVAKSQDGSAIYVSQGDRVTIINTLTNSVTGFIPLAVSRRLDALTLSADGKTLYVASADENNIIVIDTQTNTVKNYIDAGISPSFFLMSADGSKLYASSFAANTLKVISLSDGKVIKAIPLKTGPYSMSLSLDGSRIFVTGEQAAVVSVISTATNEVINTIPVGLTPTSYGNFIGEGTDCPGPSTTFTITVNSNKPTITSTGLLTALSTVYGTPSASASFTLSGTNLTDGILISPPDGFDVSTDNINFSHSVMLGGAGVIAPAKVYVRLNQATAAGNYSGLILLTSSGAANVIGPNSTGTVKPALLTIIANTIHKPYGNMLSSQIASADFIAMGLQNSEEIGSVTITYGQGANAADVINTYNGMAVPSAATGGTFTASNYIITYVNGDIVVDAVPVITYTQNLADLTTTYGMPSASTTFTVSGKDLSAGVLVNLPAGFEVSTDNINFYKTATLGGAGSVNSVKVYIRLTSKTNVGTYPGDVVLSSPGAVSKNISLLNNIVNKAPLAISANNVAKIYGDILTSGSGSGAFTTNGLQNAETVGSVAITYDKGQAGTDIVGVYNGSVLPGNATGGTFNPGNYAISYINGNLTVNAALLTITAVNKSKKAGDPNPELEAVYSGFKNNESVLELTTPPLLTTTAITASPVGQYPINVSGASAVNYSFTYVDGVLTIDPVFFAIKIPNAFTPNGDGTNDTWEIKYLDSYPSVLVNVYNRYGANIFSSMGYSSPWNGKYKGGNVPAGIYYYIINLGNKSGNLSGYVAVIR